MKNSTPGPWELVVKDDKYWEEVIIVGPLEGEERPVICGAIMDAGRDGYLLAAAPEMLDALLLVVNSGPLNNGLRDENTMRIVNEAVAKATGQSTVDEFNRLEADKLKGRL